MNSSDKCLLKGKRYLYRYLNEAPFKATLRNGIKFVEPSTWQDSFEKRFYKANYNAVNPYFPVTTYACCFTLRKLFKDALSRVPNTIFYEGPVEYTKEYVISNLHLPNISGA